MSPSLIFVDHPHHRMRNVKEFLAGWGIKISNAEKMSRGKSNMVAMGELLAIRKTVKSMSLFLHKRANQA